ncbi:acyltransferase family protein [Herbaspirillum sp. WKF16]|uniref:acyltransferase family protein n=1 Tax=Herbaspirillum sp. WKF16 TaxID=3028312 RepID=UPI0023A96F6B|nr:acyltransferase family protein [Herbaspirillum sp. WKF16]WDZ97913.1 acyltransferase family protein [Herbaspirillum sp. WKF16]
MLLINKNDAGQPANLKSRPGEAAGEAAPAAIQSPHPGLHPKYRPDIDGLRAVAVGSVVIFHAFPEWFAGGFIGVDIFFVISGFLISLIIFNNLEHGRFSIVDFYVRRVKRIFPALMTVMTLCLAAGWVVLFADEYKQLGKHLFGGSTFISNILFWRESGYFDNSAETKPLLHLWSLAIEEQFYLFWPLLLAFVWKRRWGFLRIMAVIAALSFAINIYLIGYDQTAAFYSPLARFWELMVGGALGYINLHRQDLNGRHKNLQAWLGVALLGAGFVLMDGSRAFPGWWALLPAIGAFLLLSAGPQAWFNRTVLASKPMVSIGLISYPLYLWHWPLLAFSAIIAGQTAPSSWRVAAVGAALLLSWLTFRFIERPLRGSGNLRVVLALLAVNVAVGLGGMAIYLNDGFGQRAINKKLDYISENDIFEGSRNSDGSCARLNGMPGVDEEVCLSNSSAPRTLFVGDSHVMALHSAVFAGQVKMPAMMVAGHACRVYPNLPYEATHRLRWSNNCTAIANEAIAVAGKLPSIDTVVISGAYPRDNLERPSEYAAGGRTLSAREAFLSGYGALIDSFIKAGKRVVFMADVPYLKLDPHACVNRFEDGVSRECAFTQAEHKSIRKDYDAAVAELQRRHPGAAFFDPEPLFCRDGMCRSKLGDAYLYNDTQHISLAASKQLLDEMRKQGLLSPPAKAPGQ